MRWRAGGGRGRRGVGAHAACTSTAGRAFARARRPASSVRAPTARRGDHLPRRPTDGCLRASQRARSTDAGASCVDGDESSSPGRDFYARAARRSDGGRLAYLAWDHPAHAVGRAPSCGWTTEHVAGAGRRLLPAAELAARRHAACGSTTAPAGGTCTGRRAIAPSRPKSATPPGSSASRTGRAARRHASPSPRARNGFDRAATSTATRSTRRSPSSSGSVPVPGRPRLHRRRARRTTSERRRRSSPGGARRGRSGPASTLDARRRSAVPEHVSFGHRARALLPADRDGADQRRRDRARPRRADRAGGVRRSTSTIQFLTSRGFAVADVDYRGSTGYGRGFREALRGPWGVADVEDCVACVEHLAADGQVDGAARSSAARSAGGYTTLQALTTTDAFAAGSSRVRRRRRERPRRATRTSSRPATWTS